MTKDEIVKTLIYKYGAVEVSRMYIRGIRNALSNIRNGIETNNFALSAKDVGLLNENLDMLERLFNTKEGREQITHDALTKEQK